MNYLLLLIPAAIVFALMVVIGLVLIRFYKKATPSTALVRTGKGGQKVVMGGGVIVIPGLHDLLQVNMKTMVITVSGGDGLITKDQRRVDATAQFYIRVKPDSKAIGDAAQSLGEGTKNIDVIRSVLEGKVQDTMRAIAAGMDLIDLHQSRADFVEQVRRTLNKEIEPNGLELESVSLTHLDETPFERLNEQNTFDATGMRARAELLAEQRKRRVAVEESAELEVSRTQQANRIARLEVERAEQEASNDQRVKVAEMKAAAETREAQIAAEVQQAREVAEVEREAAVRQANILREQELMIAQQQADIEVARNSELRSKAEAAANTARAEAIVAEEAIRTAKDTEIADREKKIAVIVAEQEAEREATGIRVRARAEREAAEDYSQATISRAKADAQADEIRAAAIAEVGKAEASARAELVAAENEMSPEVMAFKLRQETIARLPEIIQAMTEPMRHVESIRINQITGLGGATGGEAGATSGEDGVVGQLMNGMRRNAVAMPTLDALGKQLGLNFAGGVNGIVESVVAEPEAADEADSAQA